MRFGLGHAVYSGRMRKLHTGVVIGTVALVVAACSSGHSDSAAGTSPASSAPSAAASSSQSQHAVTVPAPSATGPLHVLLHDAFPVASSISVGAIGAEAPDGSVFAAFGTQAAGSLEVPAGVAIYVIDGDQSPQVAEHPTIPVA